MTKALTPVVIKESCLCKREREGSAVTGRDAAHLLLLSLAKVVSQLRCLLLAEPSKNAYRQQD